MSKLILKAIPANATSAAADQTLGYIDPLPARSHKPAPVTRRRRALRVQK